MNLQQGIFFYYYYALVYNSELGNSVLLHYFTACPVPFSLAYHPLSKEVTALFYQNQFNL